jgi:RNA polymerase sigma-70 factor (ECF subfamily)
MPRTLLPEELLSHAAWMRSLARSLVRDEASADDIVQETFAVVAERAPERPRAVGAWLRGMLSNLVRRSRRTEVRVRRREERAARPESDVSTPADIVERAELQRQVVDEVIALAEPYRTAVLLRYFDDLSPADIARREDVPVATVRTRLQRGLGKLRKRLDRLHGGDRAAWCAVLAPLAGLGAASGLGAGFPAAAAEGAAECAGAEAVAAGASAVTGGTKAIILGGALMTQKTLWAAVVVGVAALAAGFGIGHVGARREAAQARHEAEARRGVEAELARLRSDLDREAAARAKAVEEKDALAARVDALDAELKTERDLVAQATAKEGEERQLPISFGEFASLEGLQDADWPELAQALRAMNGLFVDLLEKAEKGEPIDPEIQKKIMSENTKLVKLAAQVMGKIPTNLAVNGEFTHPLVLANLMSAVLEESGVPLDARQAAALAMLGTDYEAAYARKQEGYSKETPQLEKVIDELELKNECVRKIRDAFNPGQKEALVPPEIAGRLQLDVLSPGVATLLSVKTKQFGSAEEARARFQESLLKDLQIADASSPGVSAAFDAWYREVEPLLAPQHAKQGSVPRVDDVLLAGRAQANLMKMLLESGSLGEQARAQILARQDWMFPQVVEKAGE